MLICYRKKERGPSETRPVCYFRDFRLCSAHRGVAWWAMVTRRATLTSVAALDHDRIGSGLVYLADNIADIVVVQAALGVNAEKSVVLVFKRIARVGDGGD